MPSDKPKRPRSSTVNSPSAKPSAKKRATSRTTSHVGTASEPDLDRPGAADVDNMDDDDDDDAVQEAGGVAFNADSGKDTEDEGVHSDDPVAAVRALTAARSGKGLTAAEKRDRFLVKFKGMKPDEVLGKFFAFGVCARSHQSDHLLARLPLENLEIGRVQAL